MADLPSATPAATLSIHRDYLEQASPDWLINATPARRAQLKQAPAPVPDWYRRATPAQRQTLHDKTTVSFTAQTALDKAMAPVQSIDTFAEPLLVKALSEQFKVTLDVHKTLLVLRKPLAVGVFGSQVSSFEVLRIALLQGPQLLKLARGLFRLDEVEKTALQRIAERTDEINNNPQLSAHAKRMAIERLEEVEIRLAYRYGLKDDLELPGQPGHARFISMGEVTQEDLTNARARVLQLNNSPEERQALLSRDFWKDYVTSKHRAQFDVLSKPFHEQLAQLSEQVDAGGLSRADYDTQAQSLQGQLGVAEAGLIEQLTATELEEHPQPGPPAREHGG